MRRLAALRNVSRSVSRPWRLRDRTISTTCCFYKNRRRVCVASQRLVRKNQDVGGRPAQLQVRPHESGPPLVRSGLWLCVLMGVRLGRWRRSRAASGQRWEGRWEVGGARGEHVPHQSCRRQKNHLENEYHLKPFETLWTLVCRII